MKKETIDSSEIPFKTFGNAEKNVKRLDLVAASNQINNFLFFISSFITTVSNHYHLLFIINHHYQSSSRN